MVKHPAKFHDTLIEVIGSLCEGSLVYDPFAGVGKIHQLYPEFKTFGGELELEWASQNSRNIVADALVSPFADCTFDTIATSPTYGNRMADNYAGDGTRRHTYRIYLGKPLDSRNSGTMQWGSKYKKFHTKAWLECHRILKTKGTLLINIKNHIRRGVLVDVASWHRDTIESLGFEFVTQVEVPLQGIRHGENHSKRDSVESVLKFYKVPVAQSG